MQRNPGHLSACPPDYPDGADGYLHTPRGASVRLSALLITCYPAIANESISTSCGQSQTKSENTTTMRNCSETGNVNARRSGEQENILTNNWIVVRVAALLDPLMIPPAFAAVGGANPRRDDGRSHAAMRLRLALLTLVVAWAVQAEAQAAYDASASGTTGTGATTIGVPITVGANSNRALVLMVGVRDQTNGVITGVSGAGCTWTKLNAGNGNGAIRGEVWSCPAPSTGAQTVTATYTGATAAGSAAVVASFYNAHQTVPASGYVLTTSGNQVVTVPANGGAVSSHYDFTDVRTVSGCTTSRDISSFTFIGIESAHCSTSPTSTFTWSGYDANSVAVGAAIEPAATATCTGALLLMGAGKC